MGVLKVRSNGQWINVGVGGGPLPPGGVLGDVVVKQSANPSDALWGTALPKLNLTSSVALTTLTQTDTALMLGSVTTPNMVFDRNSIQARDNGAAVLLNLNEFGGDIQLGMPTGTPRILIGNDAYLVDANRANALAIVSQTDTTRGVLQLGLSGNLIEGNAAGDYINLHGGTNAYIDGNTVFLRTSAYADIAQFSTNGLNINSMKINGYTLSENGGAYTIVCRTANGYVMSNYFNMTADTGYNPPYIVGGNGDNYLRWYTQLDAAKIGWGSTTMLITSTKIAGGSWADQTLIANPGTTMAGYGFHAGGTAGSIRFQNSQGKFYFNNEGGSGFYNCMANAFEVTSAERGKQEMVPLTNVLPATPRLPVATMVRALRPVWYRQREDLAMMEIPPRPDDFEELTADGTSRSWMPPLEDNYLHYCRDEGPGNCGHTPDDPCNRRTNWQRGYLGFIAEEVEQVLPHLVRLGADMAPESLDLSSLIGLAYAMLQELDTRLNALEAA